MAFAIACQLLGTPTPRGGSASTMPFALPAPSPSPSFSSSHSPSPTRPTHLHLPPTPSHSPHVTPKRLRSCLSPVRRYPVNPLDTATPATATSIPAVVSAPAAALGATGFPLSQTSTMSTAFTDEPSLTRGSSPMTSRTSSFSSACGEDADGREGVRYWRRTKSVRWGDDMDGQQGGCVMAAIYSTWSADDYDRSPLEPPKPEERACTLPARGSRCLSPASIPERTFDSISFLSLTTSNSSRTSVVHVDSSEDEEWDECMDRRQLYAAQMSLHMRSRFPGLDLAADAANADAEGHGEVERPCGGFEGYTSLSATLAALLHDEPSTSETRKVSTPVGSPEEGDSPLSAAARYREEERERERGRRRVRAMRPVLEEVEDDEEEEEGEHEEDADGDEDEDVGQPSLETVMAALRAFRSGPGPLLGTGDEQRDRREE